VQNFFKPKSSYLKGKSIMSRIKSLNVLLCPLLVLFSMSVIAQQASNSPKGAKVSIVEPKNGAIVVSPVKVVFALDKMMVMPAGVVHSDSGHHHLLVDVDALPALDAPIPADAQHLHFGKGQTETTLNLVPGTHTLQLLLGDHFHRPHNPVVASEVVKITIKDNANKSAAGTH
jgi:hypothetical protein